MIGCDEYACVLRYSEEDEGRSFVQILHREFEIFNCTSDKEYNVTVSAGICIVKPDQEISMEAVLSMADENLYQAKKHKAKNVIKSEYCI